MHTECTRAEKDRVACLAWCYLPVPQVEHTEQLFAECAAAMLPYSVHVYISRLVGLGGQLLFKQRAVSAPLQCLQPPPTQMLFCPCSATTA